MKVPDIGIVLPTYNEAGNITQLIERLLLVLTDNYSVEVVVVDDDSTDETRTTVAASFEGDPRVRVIHRTVNRGLAASIRTGIDSISARRVVVMDSDLTHDPLELPRMLHVAQVFDVVSGSRFCEGGSMASRRHYIASLSYNWALRVILRTQIQDNLGGFWTMKRSQLLKLPLDQIFMGYGDYFFRLLRYAELADLSIVELPAVYGSREYGESKSRFIPMLFSYSSSAISLRRQLRGRQMRQQVKLRQ